MLMNSNWNKSPELLEIRDCTFVVAENIPFSWWSGSCGTFTMDKTETLLGLDHSNNSDKEIYSQVDSTEKRVSQLPISLIQIVFQNRPNA